MKSFFSLLLALLIIALFGGAAWFYWDISNNVKFERKPEAGGQLKVEN